MKDYIVRATAYGGKVRAFAGTTKNLVGFAKSIHGLSNISSVALGEALTVMSLMSVNLKNSKDSMTLQIKSDGPLGGAVVVTDARQNVRGYVNFDNPDLDNIEGITGSQALGENGSLNIIKDLGLKKPYIGYINLISGELEKNIEYYYKISEQSDVFVRLEVVIDSKGNINAAGGYIIQFLDGVESDLLKNFKEKLKDLPDFKKLLIQGATPEKILEKIFEDGNLKIYDSLQCQYKCTCTRDRMIRNLISLGKTEIQDIIDKDKKAQIICYFCNKEHNFSENDLNDILHLI